MNGKSLICSVLQLTCVILIMWFLLALSDHIVLIFIGILCSGGVWLGFDTLEAKGKFRKLDQKIYDTRLFQFFHRFRTIVYFLLFAIGFALTIFIFS